MKEKLINPDLLTQFLQLPVGFTMKMPIVLLTPTTIDDFKSSHSAGPIEAYPLWSRNDEGVNVPTIWIGDGNHRYYEKQREAMIEAGRANRLFRPENVFIEVLKIDPDKDPDHDIRVMFNTEPGKWKKL